LVVGYCFVFGVNLSEVVVRCWLFGVVCRVLTVGHWLLVLVVRCFGGSCDDCRALFVRCWFSLSGISVVVVR
jgi:hypothetical protein